MNKQRDILLVIVYSMHWLLRVMKLMGREHVVGGIGVECGIHHHIRIRDCWLLLKATVERWIESLVEPLVEPWVEPCGPIHRSSVCGGVDGG